MSNVGILRPRSALGVASTGCQAAEAGVTPPLLRVGAGVTTQGVLPSANLSGVTLPGTHYGAADLKGLRGVRKCDECTKSAEEEQALSKIS